ncbi:3-hydroxyacyl-CoA dehydrogenase [Vreelandella malpeensis]|uniref:3-hydroxyacyl-CoA dehydrogenase n=1 Tax=Vreelandella malpeensis TaxID=1172368 RepID=A0ABS8DPB0_9GAMM|nr:3-hydroxyacyl-CoA dehydrogenase [Halomonas malpeensis]MCB8888136.1 3-hydroxyacyl-CoA dehydrogenase [Halomonas malpeensis]
MTHKIAVVGAGLIGRAWAIVFARAGLEVRLFDIDIQQLDQVRGLIDESLDDLKSAGLIEAPSQVASRIAVEVDLTVALAGVGYVQECGPENVAAKQALYTQLEAVCDAHTILASSTSGIVASHFSGHLRHPERCLVAHPVNPPYLIPLVEVVPGPRTSSTVVERTLALMRKVRQEPILVRKEVQGFVLNRLQGALLNEALRLYRDGYVSAEDLDKTVKHGLGLRWSFMGPFETIDLNAPNGVVDYAGRYGPLYYDVDTQRSEANPWAAPTLERLEQERREVLPVHQLLDRQAWRDRHLMALMAHKQRMAN